MRRLALAVAVAAAMLAPALLVRGQVANVQQPHGDLQLDCGDCHTPEKWVPVEKPPLFRHDKTGFPLELAHARASCRSCHSSLVFNRVGTSCADCHKDSHRGELGARCESCHTPASWSNQREMFQVHSRTRLPLFAAHARLDCTACHRNQRPYQYASTPAECGDCHLETYHQTTSPPHAASGFSLRCLDCHQAASSTWRGAAFSHPASFPLAGGHNGLACARCHGSGTYVGLSRACFSCHQSAYAGTTNPNHAAGGFSTSCEGCHSIEAWRPASFDHARSRFPLTGAHASLDCTRCHQGGRYTGTPTDCYACHQTAYNGTTNPNHAASGFPAQCEACHNTSAWRPASFNHDGPYFPIYSGRHRGRWSSCSECHVNPGNYRAFECILCHEHSNRSEVDRDHRDESGYSYQSAACYRCHPRGEADDDFRGVRGLRKKP